MVDWGIDAHKRSHTVVAVDEHGRQLGIEDAGNDDRRSSGAAALGRTVRREARHWAVEDCRHLSRRLERDLLAAGERWCGSPPKLMAHARDSARTYGKSDPIDALAVAGPRCASRTCPRPPRRTRPGGAAAHRSPGGPGR